MKADIEKLFLDSLINSLPDNIYFKDTESRFLMVNRALAQRFGLKDPSEALGRTDFDFFTEEHSSKAREDELKVMATGKPIIAKEEHEVTLDGQPKWVLTTKLPLYDTDGKMIGTFGVSRDVTEIKMTQQALLENEAKLKHQQEQLESQVLSRTRELTLTNERLEKEVQDRKQVEQSLRISEERYRRLIHVNPAYIYTVSLSKKDAIVTDHGPGCVNVTGYTSEEFEQDPNLWIIIVHPEDRELVKRFITEDLTQRNHQNQIEHRIIHKDGRVHWVRNTVVHHYDDDGELIRFDGLIEDITARKHADERHRENERLRALSVMAEGVVNNYSKVMEQIAWHASAISRKIAKNSAIHDEAEAILKFAESATELNKRLSTVARTYSSDKKESAKPVKVKKVVSKAVKPLKRTFSQQGVVVTTALPPRVPAVTAVEEQLLDVLAIVLLNAAEAMPEGGEVTITASVKKILRSSHRWNQTARGGKYLVLRVIDTGVGMDPEVAERIFDSFYSTKRESAFGLGLAMAQAAVKSWGGWIRLRTVPGEGTVFRIFVPVAKQDEDPDLIEAPRTAVSLKGKTALVVEDDSHLLERISESLGWEGVNVITATSSAEAIDLFTDNIDKVHVCIVDLILGDDEWQKTISQIYHMKPEASVIVMSGFSRDFVRSSIPVGAWSFLQKPFDTSVMVQLTKDILSREHA